MGGGVITYIKESIKFTRIKTIEQRDEAQLLKIQLHLQPKVSITLSNLYLTPQHLPVNEDDSITRKYLTEALKEDAIVVSDINGHSEDWYSESQTDHRGTTIEEILSFSDALIINEDVPTRKPFNRGNNNIQDTAPDITAIPAKYAAFTQWETVTQLSSDHLPIIITINSATTNKKKNKTFTNYKKAKWKEFKEHIENKIENFTEIEDPHQLNRILTEAIIESDKLYIPKGCIRTKSEPIPEQIRLLIAERNELRQVNSRNPALTQLNEQIKQEVREQKRNIWQEKTDSQKWDQKRNTNQYWAL